MTILPMTIVDALYKLGFDQGYACNEIDGIVLWDRLEPQPTEAALIAAGWMKPEPAQEATEE